MSTPTIAANVISDTNCTSVTCQICLLLIHKPMVRAAISGNIISVSPVNSANAIIATIIARADKYFTIFLFFISYLLPIRSVTNIIWETLYQSENR